MSAFDYDAAAELFPGAARPARGKSVSYRRFVSAAEALRFALEELSPGALAGAALEVGDERYDCHAMRALYEAADYPFARRMPASARASGPVPSPGAPKNGRASRGRD